MATSVRRSLLGVLLVLAAPPPVHADAPEPDTFGPAVRGLRLALTLAPDLRTARFHVTNTGRSVRALPVEFSCSGFHPFALEVRAADGTKIDDLTYANETKALAPSWSRLRSACTRNVATRVVRLRSGQTANVDVPIGEVARLMILGSASVAGSAHLLEDADAIDLATPPQPIAAP